MTSTPSVVSARHLEGHRLEVTFADGTTKSIDFSRWLNGPVFEPLKDVAYFRRFFLEGGTVTWPNGAGIAPETLYAAREVDEAA